MRTTVNLDDVLLKDATGYAPELDRTALLHAALKAFIEREASKRAASLLGSAPGFVAGPRKRPSSGRKRKAA